MLSPRINMSTVSTELLIANKADVNVKASGGFTPRTLRRWGATRDCREETWRIVDPVLNQGSPLHSYEPNTWGPIELDQRLAPRGGWHNPRKDGNEEFSLAAHA